MNKLLWLIFIVVCFFLHNCSLPITKVETADSRPVLAIKNAPENSTLFIDDLLVGNANDYNGSPRVLLVEPGTHKIIIRTHTGDSIHSQSIFVESGLKIITVNKSNH
jgi:hypothetical protein